MVTDGQEVGRQNAIYCGWAKIWITDLLTHRYIQGHCGWYTRDRRVEFFCEDMRVRRYQINLRMPENLLAGVTDLVSYVADTVLPAVSLTIVGD